MEINWVHRKHKLSQRLCRDFGCVLSVSLGYLLLSGKQTCLFSVEITLGACVFGHYRYSCKQPFFVELSCLVGSYVVCQMWVDECARLVVCQHDDERDEDNNKTWSLDELNCKTCNDLKTV